LIHYDNLGLHEKNAQEILEALNNNNIYTNKVTEILLEEIKKCTFPSIETVAKKTISKCAKFTIIFT
jgi:hypothetical protein